MAPWTSVNHSAVFQQTDRIHSKTHPACRIYAVSPSSLLPFFPCYFFEIRKPNANSELRIETFHSLVMSPAFPWVVKCLAYHQSSTDLVDIFCQSLHFKVGKPRVLKEMYYHWLWNFPLSNSKTRVYQIPLISLAVCSGTILFQVMLTSFQQFMSDLLGVIADNCR